MGKNILHVVNIYFVLPYFIGDQFLYFRNKGYRMYVVCSHSEFLDDYARKQGFDYLESPIDRSIAIRHDLISLKNICLYVRKKKIDIIVGHTPKGGLLAMLAGWLCRVPTRIYFRHGIIYETSHGVKRLILKTIDRIASYCSTRVVCVSPSVLQKSLEDGLTSRPKLTLLGNGTCNGIDTINHFNPDLIDENRLAELRHKYSISKNDFVIGYTGRLVRDKGIVELVEAFEKIENREQCKLLLVGMFEERDSLPNDMKERILHDPYIIYTGFVNGGMEYYYAMMNVYVLASYREGFPTGVLEAQAMAKPVITTRATGCKDSIAEGKTGLFVGNDAKDIAEKIERIRKVNAIDGRNGRQWVVEKFDCRKIWQEIEKLY